MTNVLLAATPPIVPRADGEGSLGTNGLAWSNAWFKTEVNIGTSKVDEAAIAKWNSADYLYLKNSGGSISGVVRIIAEDTTDEGDILQNNGLILDGPTNTDKQIIFAENGTNHWAIQGAWRGEKGKYFYIYNGISQINPIVISESGRVGVNKQINLLGYHVNWSRIDDMAVGGEYNETRDRAYEITITSTNATNDMFSVAKKFETQSQYTITSSNNLVSTNGIDIGLGTVLYWESETGHQIGDKYWFLASAMLPQASLSVAPRALDEVSIITNLFMATTGNPALNYLDVTAFANSYDVGISIPCLYAGTNTAIYVGSVTPVNTLYFDLVSNAVGAKLVFEYWDGGEWVELNQANNLEDYTLNFTQSGAIFWSVNTFIQSKTNLTVSDYVDEYYWIRIYSTNAVTSLPWFGSISPHGIDRFSIYGANGDLSPAMSVKGNGDVQIGDYTLTESTIQSFYWKFLATLGTNQTLQLPTNVWTKVNFSNVLNDVYLKYDTTNYVWKPNTISICRLITTLSIAQYLADNVVHGYDIGLFENNNFFATIYTKTFVEGNVAGSPILVDTVSFPYVFVPNHITNTYDVRIRSFADKNGTSAWVTNYNRGNRIFGEKLQ